MKQNSSKIALSLLALAAILVLATPFALATGERGVSLLGERIEAETVSVDVAIERPTIPVGAGTSVAVMSIDPAQVFAEEGGLVVEASNEGPFDAHQTLNLYVVTMFQGSEIGTGAFDQVTRFVLPDGSVYETRISPVDLGSEAGDTVKRMELASHPVPVIKPSPVRMNSSEKKAADLGDQVFTSVTLPVSGTWITKHNLYGTWQVEVLFVRDGELITSAQTSFDIGIDF